LGRGDLEKDGFLNPSRQTADFGPPFFLWCARQGAPLTFAWQGAPATFAWYGAPLTFAWYGARPDQRVLSLIGFHWLSLKGLALFLL